MPQPCTILTERALMWVPNSHFHRTPTAVTQVSFPLFPALRKQCACNMRDVFSFVSKQTLNQILHRQFWQEECLGRVRVRGWGVGVRLGFGLGCLGLGLGLRLGLALQLQQGGKLVVFYTLLSMRSSHSSLKLASTKDAIVLLHCHSHVSSNSCNPGCCLRCLQHKGCGSGWRHRLEWLPGATTFSALP